MARFPRVPGRRKNDILSQLHLDSIINHPGCTTPRTYRPKSRYELCSSSSIVMLVFHRARALFGHRREFVLHVFLFFFSLYSYWIENCTICYKINCESSFYCKFRRGRIRSLKILLLEFWYYLFIHLYYSYKSYTSKMLFSFVKFQ